MNLAESVESICSGQPNSPRETIKDFKFEDGIAIRTHH